MIWDPQFFYNKRERVQNSILKSEFLAILLPRDFKPFIEAPAASLLFSFMISSRNLKTI